MSIMFEVKKDINKLSAKYNGGYSNLLMRGSITLKIVEDKVMFKQLWKTYHTLDVRCIKDVQFKTEEEVSKDVTLTRLLAVGVFALALKKRRVTNRYYVVITTNEDGFDNNIVLQVEDTAGLGTLVAEGFIATLKKAVVKYR